MERFTAEGICKDVIDTPPPKMLTVKYPGGISLTPGMVLTPTQVKDKPEVSFEADPNSFYTLLMHDPDAPSRAEPTAGEIQHWLVVNIPGGDVSKGQEMTAYRGSGAPQGTGLHRYIFLLYRQQGKQEFDLPVIPFDKRNGRPKNKVRDFVAKFGLKELVAGNFFLAEYDDYVPILKKTYTDQ
ncbi:hypothetical protein BaRGS_00033377 [Batillaria attramentaria]|uniref:Uncharacterized protein n=1 Tax=Batillaria attramentaria TaxID=370345 RepID=A0ABD0JKK4_9CAEN